MSNLKMLLKIITYITSILIFPFKSCLKYQIKKVLMIIMTRKIILKVIKSFYGMDLKLPITLIY